MGNKQYHSLVGGSEGDMQGQVKQGNNEWHVVEKGKRQRTWGSPALQDNELYIKKVCHPETQGARHYIHTKEGRRQGIATRPSRTPSKSASSTTTTGHTARVPRQGIATRPGEAPRGQRGKPGSPTAGGPRLCPGSWTATRDARSPATRSPHRTLTVPRGASAKCQWVQTWGA